MSHYRQTVVTKRRDSEWYKLRKSPSKVSGNKTKQPLSGMRLRNRQFVPSTVGSTGASNSDTVPTAVGDLPSDSNILRGSLEDHDGSGIAMESAKRKIAFVNGEGEGEGEDSKMKVHPPQAESTPYRPLSHSVLDTTNDNNVSLTRRPLWTSTVAAGSEEEEEDDDDGKEEEEDEDEEGTDSGYGSGGSSRPNPPAWMSLSAGEMLTLLLVSFTVVLLVFLQLTASKE